MKLELNNIYTINNEEVEDLGEEHDFLSEIVGEKNGITTFLNLFHDLEKYELIHGESILPTGANLVYETKRFKVYEDENNFYVFEY